MARAAGGLSGGPAEADVRAAKRELVGRYLAPPNLPVARAAPRGGRVPPGPAPIGNVVGLGVGEKVVDGRLAGTLCVKVYVRTRYPLSEIADGDRVPTAVGGIPTDVEEVGRIQSLQQACSPARRQRQRPAPGGVSAGHFGITAGTLGALARDTGRDDNGRRYILSNNHVLANSNAAAAGDVVVQPGPLDGGAPAEDRIGALTRFVPIDFTGEENSVDGAIAEVSGDAVLGEICSIGPIAGTAQPAREVVVRKHGRTTGLTRGVITDVDADIRVDYGPAGEALFINTTVIRGLPPTTPFSDGGDSGSVIVDPERRACALLFAGASAADLTFANPIRTVLSQLRVRLV